MKPEQIKKIRGSLGLDQTQFGLLVGVKRASISAWENGHPLRPRNLIKLMELLNKKWVGLTDEEYEAMAEQYLPNCYFHTLKYAKAIETKLKDKNT